MSNYFEEFNEKHLTGEYSRSNLGQVRSGQVRSGQVRSGQVREHYRVKS